MPGWRDATWKLETARLEGGSNLDVTPDLESDTACGVVTTWGKRNGFGSEWLG